MKQLYFVLLILAGWQTSLAQSLTPAQIITKTMGVYRSATTYQDTGEVVTHNKNTEAHWYESTDLLIQKPFQTAFIRKTGQFRFRYKDIKPKKSEIGYLVWSDGTQIKTWSVWEKKIRRDSTLKQSLRRASGTSFSSSVRVPGLLLGFEAPDWNLTDVGKLVALPPMVVANKTCYHIRGTIDRQPYGARAKSTVPIKGPTESHPSIEVWIDMTTFLIIRISETYNRGSESFEYTIAFYPALNQPIKPEVLVFDYENFR